MSKIKAIFTSIACLITGGMLGSASTLMLQKSRPGSTAAVTTNVLAEKTGGAYEAVITDTPQPNVLHVRVHTWIAQFTMASVCLKGKVAEPKPCHYEADVLSASSFAPGQEIRLTNVAPVTDGMAPHTITPKIPDASVYSDKIAGPVKARALSLIDGDTVRVAAETWEGHYVFTNIRIGGIDTPEKKRGKSGAKCKAEARLAEQASAETARLLEGKEVLVYGIQTEKYGGRVLGDVRTLDGISAAQSLIDKNLARPYDGGKKSSWCPN